MNELYAIGDVARRIGLSVSAIRYYADAGVVTPAASTPAGHRLYDVSAIARLELVRTLRELDAGLDEVRRVLAGEATLRELATTHLALLARQEARLRSRRAVLSTILRQDSTRPLGWRSQLPALDGIVTGQRLADGSGQSTARVARCPPPSGGREGPLT
jgi:DNA-binding transcriptional MerR regulator